MKATIYMIVTMLIFSMSIVACKGGKSEHDAKESDSVIANSDSSHFVLKHLDVDKQRITPYVTCSE